MKVYVLLREEVIDGEINTGVSVFETLGAAKAAMLESIQCADIEDKWITEEDEMSYYSAYEWGFYNNNHYDLTIYEREVEPDKELQ